MQDKDLFGKTLVNLLQMPLTAIEKDSILRVSQEFLYLGSKKKKTEETRSLEPILFLSD